MTAGRSIDLESKSTEKIYKKEIGEVMDSCDTRSTEKKRKQVVGGCTDSIELKGNSKIF